MATTEEVPPPSGLVGIAEIAAMLGVRPSTVSGYHSRGQLPDPYVILACGSIWLRADIEHWRDHERRGQGWRGTR